MRTLILGGTGTIGSAIADACEDRRLPHLVTGYRGTAPDTTPLDVRDADAVRELIADYQPEATVYAAPANARGISNVPCSKRLYHRIKPPGSHHNAFMRSPRRLTPDPMTGPQQ